MDHGKFRHARLHLISVFNLPNAEISIAEMGPLHLTKTDLTGFIMRARFAAIGVGPIDDFTTIDKEADVRAIFD